MSPFMLCSIFLYCLLKYKLIATLKTVSLTFLFIMLQYLLSLNYQYIFYFLLYEAITMNLSPKIADLALYLSTLSQRCFNHTFRNIFLLILLLYCCIDFESSYIALSSGKECLCHCGNILFSQGKMLKIQFSLK